MSWLVMICAQNCSKKPKLTGKNTNKNNYQTSYELTFLGVLIKGESSAKVYTIHSIYKVHVL